jgi:hypothetical protein
VATPLNAFGAVRPHPEMERALLAVLSDDFIATTVVRDRARLRSRETAPIASKRMLLRTLHPAAVLSALRELERRGLAERLVSGRCTWWRRAREADDPSEAELRD